MTDVDDVVPWLREQIAERRRLAVEAKSDGPGTWSYVETPGGDRKVVDYLGYSVSGHYDVNSEPWWTGPHIALNDPRTVLAQCDAHETLVGTHDQLEVASLEHEAWGKSFTVCRSCWVPGTRRIVHPCPTLRAVALAYQHLPGYRQEWRP